MQLIDSNTFLNLARSYSSECQAMVRYKFIEYGARYNGYNALAEIIDKVVYNEFNHARTLYTHIQDASKEQIDNIDISAGTPFREKWDLTDNLRLAALDEEKEAKIYKTFAKEAAKEGFPKEEFLFNELAKIEDTHKKLFLDLHKQMLQGTMYKKDKNVKWKCIGCGYESFSNEAFETCPVCGAKQGQVGLIIKGQ